jgi:hypothetical protein
MISFLNCETWRDEGFECVLEWIASSCIECWRLECLDVLNGGGWGCIYSHQPLPSRWAILLSADGPRARSGRSAPVDQRLKMQRSAVTAISTVTPQVSISRYVGRFILISDAQWKFLFLDHIYLHLSSYSWKFHQVRNYSISRTAKFGAC